jgi:hypothetical protein
MITIPSGPSEMPSSISRSTSEDLRERIARAELAIDHSIQDRRDIWAAIVALRDGYTAFASKTDIFLAKAEEVLKRVDEHGVSLLKIQNDAAETKGRRGLFAGAIAFMSSILAGAMVYFFPRIFGGH